ncbi:MAG: PQQ-binding-like beta-propeller repeat protein [Acidobacteria bacterium]|nr:PQQ-binding-like beta-propeller repeat protein [Acidobacteriota bacterium]
MFLMRFSISLFIAALVAAAALHPASAQVTDFVPVTDSVLQNPDPADWLTWRRDQNASGYSPLDQITRQNVQKLRLAWAWGMSQGVQEQEPIVYRGVMYLPHSTGVVQALDARTGALLWEHSRSPTRNLAIYRDKIYLTTTDAYLVALDAKTGNMVWETKTGDPDKRVDYSSGPIAGDGKIFAGQTCGVGTPLPCFVGAHDAQTGKLLWKRESVAGPGDSAEHNASWGATPYEKRRKASFWLTGSYDPALKLVYWSTASAYPYPEVHKGSGSGSLLYTNSILALDPDTGEIKWFFQMQPRDNFDMDHQDNPILADVEINGARRKVVYVLGKPGILWAFDRENGTYLWHRQLVAYQNLYKNIDPQTGAITMNEEIIPTEVGTSQLVCPGMRGGKLYQTNAYNPRTNAIYSPVSNACTIFEIVPLEQEASGVVYDQLRHMEGAGGNVGRLSAVSASTGEILWTYDQRAAMGSVLTTAGGLVFAGDLHRYFRAFDAETGEVLLEIPLSGPITGYPISYAVDGKQYVAIAVGGSTSGTRHMARLYPELKAPAESNLLMVFALGE